MIVALRTDRNFVVHSHISAKCKHKVLCYLFGSFSFVSTILSHASTPGGSMMLPGKSWGSKNVWGIKKNSKMGDFV